MSETASRPQFLVKFVRNLFDVSPPALAASAVQFGIVLGIAWLLQNGCLAMWGAKNGYCNEDLFSNAAGVLPTVTFWVVAILLSIVAFLLMPILWVSIPFALILGITSLGSILPSWCGIFLVTIGFCIAIAFLAYGAWKVLNGKFEGRSRSDWRKL